MTNIVRPPFPTVLDSTLVASFRSCPRKFMLEYLEHWKPKTQSVHLIAGAAFASGLEHMRIAFYERGHSPEDSLAYGLKALFESYGDFECPEDSAKSATRMAGALEYYATQYPLTDDTAKPYRPSSEKSGIEFSFSEPLDATHPETGDPILYVGRMDMIVEYAGGIFGEDDKTTSSLGATWAKQWDLRSQFTGYTWGCQQAGIPLQGFLVRGISILKTKYDTQQALTYRPQWMLDRWYEQLMKDIDRMKKCWESGYWDYDLDHACTEYGGCIFRQCCMTEDPQPWLESGFQRRVWNPVTRAETVL
jgi:hypothetical protein